MDLKDNLRAFSKIILGNALMGFAYAKWMKPDAIINGGVTSLSMVGNKAFGIPLLYLTNGITLVLLIVSLIGLGRQNFVRSLLSSIFYNVFFSLFYLWPANFQMPLIIDFLLACVLIAYGYYLCITADASTVGMDVVALVLHKRNPKLNVAHMIRWLNYLVLAFGFLVYGWRAVLLGLAFSFVNTAILTWMLNKNPEWAQTN